MSAFRIGDRDIGHDHLCFVVAEVGINHNGDVVTALELVDAAKEAGADAVKMQVGDPERYVNRSAWDVPRETPWGTLRYIDYRKALELSPDQLARVRAHAESRGLVWFASPLDSTAVDTLENLDVPCYKVASPMVTDTDLLGRIAQTGKPAILSSGMTTMDEMDRAVDALRDTNPIALLHCTSAYPCPPELVNLKAMTTLKQYGVPVGYSGHETGIPQSLAAVAMGACIIERHLTLSRAMWGSDQAASLEPHGFAKLVEYIRTVEASMGDGVKRVYTEEHRNMRKFRRAAEAEAAA